MNNKLNTILMAAVAASFFAGLAGRAGAAQFGIIPRAFGNPLAQGRIPSAQPQITSKKCKLPKGGGIAPYLFASDNISNNLYEYCEDMPPNPTAPRIVFSAPNGFAGWGLAVSPSNLGPLPLRERLAVGTTGGYVNVYNVNNNGLLTQQRTLTLGVIGSARGNALGICFDGTGGLYATNFPYSEIDYFNNAAVLAGAAVPTTRLATTMGGSAFFPTYLACDYDTLVIGPNKPPNWENYVMADGVDGAGNADVGQLNTASGLVTVLGGQVLGPYGLGNHFPGGMTIDKHDNLVVSDWYAGTLLDFGHIEPWPSPVARCEVPGFPSNGAYLPIDFDDTQNEIWAGNSFSTSPGAAADAVSIGFPFKTLCMPGESGGPTAILPTTFFVGVAVWPDTGV